MKKLTLNIAIASLTLVVLSHFVMPLSFADTDSAAAANKPAVADYTAAHTKVTKLPAYRPLKRVLLGISSPELLAQAQAIAPQVEFVAATSEQASRGSFDAVMLGCSQAEVLAAAGDVAWIHALSAGVDACLANPKMTGLRTRAQGVIVTNSRGTAAPVIAEHALAMTLAMARGLHIFRDQQADSNWSRELLREGNITTTIADKTMLVLGLGSIGKEVAKRAHALGMKVLATRNSSREGPDYVDYVGLASETLELAQRADVVVNALPLTESTRGLIDKTFLQTMPNTAFYVSVGRGGTTDTDALLAALQDNLIAGAALDVTDPEPLPKSHPLWQQKNVIITPHLSGSGGESRRKTVALALENLRRYQAQEPLLNLVDIRLGY